MNSARLSPALLPALLPVILLAGFLLLLPFARLSELPLALLALSAPWLLWHQRELIRTNAALRRDLLWMLWLGLAWCVPMLLSALDSLAPAKSWAQSLAALRLPLMAVSTILLLKTRRQLHWLHSALAVIIGFWVIDGLVQAAVGHNLLGMPADDRRLGGVFGNAIWYFGTILAMLSPLLLEYLWRQARTGWFVLGLVAVVLLVLLAGMRAGWLLLPLIVLVYSWRVLRSRPRRHWPQWLLLAVLLAAGVVWLASQSDIVQQRWQHSLAVLESDPDSLQTATTQRWLIWQTAMRMIAEHPLNGVGVRAFPQAYPEYAGADDPQLSLVDGRLRGNRHPHHFWLEALTDCGIIGLLGLLMFMLLLLRAWWRAEPVGRMQASAFFFALLLILFPFNTHYSLYGTFMSTLIWWLLALALAALRLRQ
ncbi:MAG: O-antigen ligase family protein [Gammaproteobacteria bacterium]|nr:O-antigen ligase family protein [Gammaproteobacteria bacterium]